MQFPLQSLHLPWLISFQPAWQSPQPLHTHNTYVHTTYTNMHTTAGVLYNKNVSTSNTLQRYFQQTCTFSLTTTNRLNSQFHSQPLETDGFSLSPFSTRNRWILSLYIAFLCAALSSQWVSCLPLYSCPPPTYKHRTSHMHAYIHTQQQRCSFYRKILQTKN